jgi:pimeloyl-ACP methyl ester carboxylesterase
VEKLAVIDTRVKDFIGLAGAAYGSFGQTTTGAGSKVPRIPGMLEFGSNDTIVQPSGMVSAYNALRQPKRLVTITGAGHLVFADICQLNPGGGGLVGEALAAHLPVPTKLQALGTDGCAAPDLQVTQAWPAINQSVTAQLRWGLGFDSTQAGLEGLTTAFNGIVGLNTTANSTTLAEVPQK